VRQNAGRRYDDPCGELDTFKVLVSLNAYSGEERLLETPDERLPLRVVLSPLDRF
jgi:hypothetical protein